MILYWHIGTRGFWYIKLSIPRLGGVGVLASLRRFSLGFGQSAGYPLAGDLSFGGFRSENITGGSESMSAQAVVDGWTGDSVHLSRLISSNLTEIGGGVAVSGGRVYYVIDCARPTTDGAPQEVATTVGGRSAVPAGGGVIIPVVVVTPNAEGDVIHEVKAGQTFWQLAIAYEVKIEGIKSLNNLFDNIALALLGGGIFTWLGSSKKE